MLSRRLFATGVWVLVALGLAHLFGHYRTSEMAVGWPSSSRTGS